MVDDLKIIKKKYGEEMMHFCRDAFATILEEPGVLSKLLLTYFEPSKELFSDLEKENLENSFKAFIYHKYNKEEQITITETKTPQELLSSVGYDLYECLCEDDIQSFKKYYAPGETLCTFNGGRLNDCHVFFAVKKDVDNIKREDFSNPKRQDLYGTSVISIQFDRNEAHTLSIKNRYNHRVANPDATFSNNLDNIVEGLTDSFAEHYNLKQAHIANFEIPSYERDNNGKYYKYNYEMNGIYYCPNNCILVNHEAIKYPKERYILADYFIIDRQEKTIIAYDNLIEDCFPQLFQDNPIKKIDLEIKDNTKIVKIEIAKGIVTLELDKENKIIGLTNPYIEEIGDFFLRKNKCLTHIDLPNIKIIGNAFLYDNEVLTKISLPNVERIGDSFLYDNEILTKINMPNVKTIGSCFLFNNRVLTTIDLPKVESIGFNFLANNKSLIQIELPQVERIDDNFLYDNESLSNIYLPQVKTIGYHFLCHNQNLQELYLPNAFEINNCFLYYNKSLEKINLPNVKIIGSDFLYNNEFLTEINVPNVMNIGKYFLSRNQCLEEVVINNEEVYQEFLRQHPEYKMNELARKLTKWRRG